MKRFYRRSKSKIFAGVASGIADYLSTDPIWIRLAFVIGTFIGGSTILIYLILMFVLPKDYEVMDYQNRNNSDNSDSNNTNDSNNSNYSSMDNNNSYNMNYDFGNNEDKSQTNFKIIAGIILILAGVLFFVEQILPDFNFGIMLSILLILSGIMVLFNNKIKALL